MKNLVCRLLAFGCWASCIVGPLLALYLLWDLPLLMRLLREGSSQSLKIHWETVVHWQEQTVWAIMAVNLAITLLALIVTLREAGRLPVGMIQWYLATVHAVHLNVGAIMTASHEVAARGDATVDRIRE